MPMIIAVGNQKGGVAKTTTTVSLGAALVERGLEVLAVDLDPQANLSLSLGVKRGSVRRGVADVLLGNLTAGYMAEVFSVRMALGINAVALGAVALGFLIPRTKVKEL